MIKIGLISLFEKGEEKMLMLVHSDKSKRNNNMACKEQFAIL